jgi:hypothetical protein
MRRYIKLKIKIIKITWNAELLKDTCAGVGEPFISQKR